MRRFSLVFAVAVLIVCEAPKLAAQNLLANPGFEDPLTSDGAPFVGFWEAFNGGAGASATNSSVMPRNGVMHADLSIVNTNNTFAGIFQDVPTLSPGQNVVFSVWHKRTNSLELDAEVRIEWRNSVSNTEISRTPNSVPTASITTDYTQFSLPSVVPAGVDTARVVYAIQTFSGGAGDTGTIYLDDAAFRIVPEPSSMALVGLSGLGWAMRRRRA
jgi:hypothetical protein